MKSAKFLPLLLLLAFSLPFTYLGCGDAQDFLPDPHSDVAGVVVDDLNDDSVLDIAVATYIFDLGTAHYATVILNDPNSPGDFFPADANLLSTDRSFFSIASGDLNQDGFKDLALAGYGNPYLSILFQDSNNSDTFLSPMLISVGVQSYYLTIGDLNQDGFNDIAIAGSGSPSLSILFQDSTNPGNFLPLVSLGINSNSVTIADIDGDSINDIAVTGGGVVKLLFQDPIAPGNFLAPVDLNTGSIGPTDVKIGDLDNDGHLDLAVGNVGGVGGVQGSVSILLKDPNNPKSFFSAVNYSVGCSMQEISLGDLNDDGFLDIAAATDCNPCRITILFQDMTNIGTFLPATHYSCQTSPWGFGPWSIAIGDMNGDNFNDFIVSENGLVMRLQDPSAPGTFSSRITVYKPR